VNDSRPSINRENSVGGKSLGKLLFWKGALEERFLHCALVISDCYLRHLFVLIPPSKLTSYDGCDLREDRIQERLRTLAHGAFSSLFFGQAFGALTEKRTM
jgi:hypothetical protein